MDKTEFAGLTRLDGGDPLSTDGFSFQAVNPLIIDRLLKLGARTHRHDAHPPILGPTDAPVLTLTPDGNLPSDADIAFAYTLIDTDGGETLISPVTLVTTAPPLEAPDAAPLVEVDPTGGYLTAGTYTYALTLTDPNGETTASAPFFVNVDPGTDTNRIIFTGLSDIVASVEEATGWRMYKSSSVGQLHFLAAGGAALDDVTDDGMLCADCAVTPPTQNTTSVAQGVQVTVPNTVGNTQTGVVGYRIYAAVGGAFASPSYVEQRDDFGTVIDYTHIVVNPGMPPDVSTSFGGAAQIDPDTELVGWQWKRPVATAADLPEPADDGDARVAMDDGTIFTYTGGAWKQYEAPAMNWKPAVADATLLPPLGNPANEEGDVRLVMNERALYQFTIDGWVNLTSPPHEIRDNVATYPLRRGLQFLNSTISDDIANDQTIITPEGGGGGGGSTGPLALGDSVEWLDGGGTPQAKVTAETYSRQGDWYTQEFDTALSGWINATGNVVAAGGVLKPAATHPLDTDTSYWYDVSAQRDMEISAEGFTVASLNFNALGVSIGAGANGQAGFQWLLMQDAGALYMRLQARPTEGTSWTGLGDFTFTAGAVVPGDAVWLSVVREDTNLGLNLYNATQGTYPVAESVPVPSNMMTFQGVPMVVSNITDADAWTLDTLKVWDISMMFRLFGTAGLVEKTLVDTTGRDLWAVGGTPAAGWSFDGSLRFTSDGEGLEFKGKLAKYTGSAPLADEVMFTVTRSSVPSTALAVGTGDIDGMEMGFIEFDGSVNTIKWKQGRSSDPVLKAPYVVMDNIVLYS